MTFARFNKVLPEVISPSSSTHDKTSEQD
jgi:hypothetical protein